MPNVYISLGVHGFFRDAPTTLRVQYLKIMLSSFGEEDFPRFTLNLLHSNFGYYFANNASGPAIKL